MDGVVDLDRPRQPAGASVEFLVEVVAPSANGLSEGRGGAVDGGPPVKAVVAGGDEADGDSGGYASPNAVRFLKREAKNPCT